MADSGMSINEALGHRAVAYPYQGQARLGLYSLEERRSS